MPQNRTQRRRTGIDCSEAGAPVAALQGVSDSDAEHLAAAFDIETVKDLGTDKYFLWAQAAAKLAE
ncbi:hypothetical protein [Rhodococcus jostii]|uniref:hypothetical protein n=1 Tax=Rhodococcus jostii TaxID=132919 RepID=UPI00059FB7AF